MTIIFISNNNILLTKLIPDIWEHSDTNAQFANLCAQFINHHKLWLWIHTWFVFSQLTSGEFCMYLPDVGNPQSVLHLNISCEDTVFVVSVLLCSHISETI